MSCFICERVKLAQEGKNTSVVHEFRNSYLMIGDHQFYPGYCVLFAKTHAREPHDLPAEEQRGVFDELMQASRAIAEAYQPLKLNHVSLGNVVPHVHWHIFPRYESDPNRLAHPWANEVEFDRCKTTDEDRARVRERLRALLSR